jgi:CheY-like chemotaxis protein
VADRCARAEDLVSTIAVVEDNADNRLLLQALLGERYDLVEFDNGVDALAGLSASLPDLVLLDISLPGMDGNEILARIRADERLRALPVIALTAHAMAGDREKYLNEGFNDYITKPIVDETVLFDAIERRLAEAS